VHTGKRLTTSFNTFIALVLVLSGCAKSQGAVVAIPNRIGVIRGFVLYGGSPIIPACNVLSPQQTGPELAVSTGRDGAFEMQVLPGDVTLEVKCGDDLVASRSYHVDSQVPLDVTINVED